MHTILPDCLFVHISTGINFGSNNVVNNDEIYYSGINEGKIGQQPFKEGKDGRKGRMGMKGGKS